MPARSQLDHPGTKPKSVATITCVVLGDLLRLLVGRGLSSAAGAVAERLFEEPRLVPVPIQRQRLLHPPR